ncbi:MAG: hypothetical protein KKG33_06445 [candidate division Zixibacteria bacterium]|nr:hypothetical protein [candidate division Zixibacteria bacterium]
MYRREIEATSAVALAVLALVFLLPGCGELSNNGDPPPNFPPKVFLANIPIDSASFLFNPEIHWYATDRDGYITKYRYDVVTFDDMMFDGDNVCPECFIEASRQNGYQGWTEIVVKEVPVSTSGTIRLFAHENPDSFVSQCFFIQAEDNFGARSEVVFRVLKRANHLPDTRVDSIPSPVIAGTCSESCFQLSGISVRWSGSDLLDYPGKQPDFEFHWTVYGPFEDVDDTVGIIWDNYEVDHSWNRDSTDIWTSSTFGSLTNLFRGLGSADSTLTGYFVFKVACRDDAFAVDPTPAVSVFEAIQPACERGILLIDNTGYWKHSPGALWGECGTCCTYGGDLMTGRYFPYWRHLFEEAGHPVDTIYHGLKGSSEFDVPPPRELITRYKLVVMLNESYYYNAGSELPMYQRLSEYMDIGGKVMMIGRNQFGIVLDGPAGIIPMSPSSMAWNYFTIEGQYSANWINSWLCSIISCTCDHSNEEFIGAGSLVSGLPDLDASFEHLEEYYGSFDSFRGCDGNPYNYDMWCVHGNTPFTPYPFRGVPAVNFYESSGQGQGVYLAFSTYGSEGDIDGGVCGVRYDTGCHKSAAFGFPLYAIEEEDAIGLLRGMIDWFDID